MVRDIGDTTAPNIDMLTFEDMRPPVTLTLTITDVQIVDDPAYPVHIHVAEFPGRPYKPNVTYRRILRDAWGRRSADYIGRRIRLWGDPEIKRGSEKTGGIRISHLSHLSQQFKGRYTVTRGKKDWFTVDPLEDAPPAPDKTTAALTAIRNATDHAALDKIAAHAASLGIDVTGAIEARKQELT